MINTLLSLFFLYLPFQIALNPTERVDLASIRLIIPLIFIFWLINGLKNKKIFIPHNINTLLILSFLFICGFSIIMAEDIRWGIRKFIFLLSIFPLYFVVTNLKNDNIKNILKFLVIGSSLSAIIGIYQFSLQFIFGIDRTIDIWSKIIVPFLGINFSEAVIENSSWLVNAGGNTLLRAISLFPDPHMYSFYLGMTAPISLSLYFSSKNKRSLYLISFILILLTDFLTFSRGGYVGLFVGFLFGFFIYQKEYFKFSKEQIKKILISLTFIFIFIVLFFIVPNPFSGRFYSSFSPSEGSNSERLEIWNKSFDIISNKPFLGTGLGNYSLSIKPSAEYREPIYAHNLYMDIAAETGIINSILWIIFVLFSIFFSIKLFKKRKDFIYLGIAVSIVVFSIHSIFETAIFSVHILPLFVLLVGLANNNKSEENI